MSIAVDEAVAEFSTRDPARDREGAHRRDTDIGRFEASMLSLDAHMETFDDPSKIATFSDGGKGAASVRNGGVELPEDVLEEALEQLSERDKAFVRDVLDGKRWGEMKLTRQGFNWKIREVAKNYFPPPAKTLALRHERTCGRRRFRGTESAARPKPLRGSIFDN